MNGDRRSFASLVEEVQSGNSQAFAELTPFLEPIVKKTVYQVFGTGLECIPQEDLIQEAWYATYRAVLKYDTRRYSQLVNAYFRSAILARVTEFVADNVYALALNRPLKRFLKDMADGKIDWAGSSDADVRESYPLVAVEDIARARWHGLDAYRVLTGETYWRSGSPSVSDAAEAPRPWQDEIEDRLDAQELLRALMSQLDDMEFEVFALRFRDEMPRYKVVRQLGISMRRLESIERSILSKRVGNSLGYEVSGRQSRESATIV